MTTDKCTAASFSLPLLPLPPCFLSQFFFSPHSSVTMLRSPRPQQQSWTWSGQPACSHLGHKSGWSQHTHTQIHSNCRPFPCPHVTACRSEALPHAATHKLGTLSSSRFIWWIVRYSDKDQLGLVFAFGSCSFCSISWFQRLVKARSLENVNYRCYLGLWALYLQSLPVSLGDVQWEKTEDSLSLKREL